MTKKRPGLKEVIDGKKRVIKANLQNTKSYKKYNNARNFTKEFRTQNGVKNKAKFLGKSSLNGVSSKIRRSGVARGVQKNAEKMRKFFIANTKKIKLYSIFTAIFMILFNVGIVILGLVQAYSPTPHYYCDINAPNEIKQTALYGRYCGDRKVFTTQFVVPAPIENGGFYTSMFGWRDDPFGGSEQQFHRGVDIAGRIVQIKAALSGTVREIIDSGAVGCGYGMWIDHGEINGENLSTRYCHLASYNEFGYSVGDEIQRGQFIGMMGTTGSSTGEHLHFEVRIDNEPVDPKPYLDEAEPYDDVEEPTGKS